jgi:hypothetical protein
LAEFTSHRSSVLPALKFVRPVFPLLVTVSRCVASSRVRSPVTGSGLTSSPVVCAQVCRQISLSLLDLVRSPISPFACAPVRFVPSVCCSLFHRSNFVGRFLLGNASSPFSFFVRCVSCSVLRGVFVQLASVPAVRTQAAQVQKSSLSFQISIFSSIFLCVDCYKNSCR